MIDERYYELIERAAEAADKVEDENAQAAISWLISAVRALEEAGRGRAW